MIKRFFDIVVSLMTIFLLLPIFLFLMLLVSIKIGSPVIFVQKRPGIHGKLLHLYKFRSMSNAVDEHGSLLPDAERLTSFGMKLRSTSLDEIPSLFNVLKGDMSLVGPRPLLVEYLPLYSQEQARRHNVRPGITGWAQINGRNAISWEDKFKFDVWYVDNQSFWLDIKILLLTVKKVFVREGISADGHVTIEPFRGSERGS
ncbi:Undecaprenyl-phosphate galactosephosphotransferase [Shewanella denitrificans OS217]|jgi:lipopolysaccharide/colanic/teichoic acid biosynthesis glycosyltransferase|uniref:Undecaprenyl-phosphate galactosephosphotransferase n=1 Tax=Shewanella denitrificans (strain OS217 / ATCC BAA-1090 / DSM 15013) TaxID=318161 RepID=Q12KU9_SHEDO|nr:sugar transferase [Shewanella denitrificans]ABE55927.1 Undecaprenyl-phosphate galactosephosphotransferase [Shewanella denitrificans OS217]